MPIFHRQVVALILLTTGLRALDHGYFDFLFLDVFMGGPLSSAFVSSMSFKHSTSTFVGWCKPHCCMKLSRQRLVCLDVDLLPIWSSRLCCGY